MALTPPTLPHLPTPQLQNIANNQVSTNLGVQFYGSHFHPQQLFVLKKKL